MRHTRALVLHRRGRAAVRSFWCTRSALYEQQTAATSYYCNTTVLLESSCPLRSMNRARKAKRSAVRKQPRRVACEALIGTLLRRSTSMKPRHLAARALLLLPMLPVACSAGDDPGGGDGGTGMYGGSAGTQGYGGAMGTGTGAAGGLVPGAAGTGNNGGTGAQAGTGGPGGTGGMGGGGGLGATGGIAGNGGTLGDGGTGNTGNTGGAARPRAARIRRFRPSAGRVLSSGTARVSFEGPGRHPRRGGHAPGEPIAPMVFYWHGTGRPPVSSGHGRSRQQGVTGKAAC